MTTLRSGKVHIDLILICLTRSHQIESTGLELRAVRLLSDKITRSRRILQLMTDHIYI